jgi:hypothetical protein
MSVNTDSKKDCALIHLEVAAERLDLAIKLIKTTDSNSVSGISSLWHLNNRIRQDLTSSDEFLVTILAELAHS